MKFRHTLSVHPHRAGGRLYLYLALSVEGKRAEIPTHIACTPDAYDTRRQRIRSTADTPDGATLNLLLQQHIAQIETALANLEINANGHVPTLQEVRALITHRQDDNGQSQRQSLTLDEALAQYLRQECANHQWSAGTLKAKRRVCNTIRRFSSAALLQDIDERWLADFTRSLLPRLNANTAADIVKRTRTFLRWCETADLYHGTAHNTFHPTIKGADHRKEIIYLTTDELHTLETYRWPANQQYLEHAVDTFLFACFCGLRYSDIAALRHSNIYNGAINITTQKTNDTLVIPLNQHTQRVLDKYRGQDCHGHPFPVISNQKANAYIKEACRLLGFDTPVNITTWRGGQRTDTIRPKHELITFHAARRTFITQALALGIPTEVVMKFSGHHDYAMLRPYAAVTDKAKQDGMQRFNNL